jgi:hypothetical protein
VFLVFVMPSGAPDEGKMAFVVLSGFLIVCL